LNLDLAVGIGCGLIIRQRSGADHGLSDPHRCCFWEKLGELREVGTGGEFDAEGAHRGDWVSCASGAHQCRTDDDAIGNLGDSRGLCACADAKAYGKR
jgi:hypothetical protein